MSRPGLDGFNEFLHKQRRRIHRRLARSGSYRERADFDVDHGQPTSRLQEPTRTCVLTVRTGTGTRTIAPAPVDLAAIKSEKKMKRAAGDGWRPPGRRRRHSSDDVEATCSSQDALDYADVDLSDILDLI